MPPVAPSTRRGLRPPPSKGGGYTTPPRIAHPRATPDPPQMKKHATMTHECEGGDAALTGKPIHAQQALVQLPFPLQ